MKRATLALACILILAATPALAAWQQLESFGYTGSAVSLTSDLAGNIYGVDGYGYIKSYSISTGHWQSLARVSSYTVSSLAFDGSGYIYDRDSGMNFKRYSISTGQVDSLTDNVAFGVLKVSLARGNASSIYAVSSNGILKRYNVANATWDSLASAPGSSVGAACCDGSGLIYATSQTGSFSRYDIATGQWQQLENSALSSSAIACPSANTIFGIDNSGMLKRYDVGAGHWSYVGSGIYGSSVALACGGDGFLYGLDSNGGFQRYAVPEPSSIAALLCGIGMIGGVMRRRRSR